MSITVQNIPKELIYEMVEGRPIYYKGYKEYLNGNKQVEEIMGCSYIQSLIITKLVILLGMHLSKKYTVLTNEIGLQFSERSWRAADIAVVENDKLRNIQRKDKFLKIAPSVVIEIDTKASIEEVRDTLGYFHQKTDQLIEFGVGRVIWIFTDSQKVMIAEKGEPWSTINWQDEFFIIEGISARLEDIVAEE